MNVYAASIDEKCDICLHTITNPMGVDCYFRHLDSWLVSHGVEEVARDLIRVYVEKGLPVDGVNSEMCVLCGEEYLSICSYCFVFLVANVLRKLNFSEEFVEEFVENFSYKGALYDGV